MKKLIIAGVFSAGMCINCFAADSIPGQWQLVEIPEMAGTGVRAFKDKLYDGLFTRTLGWNGGDGVVTVGLPGGNVMWTFNDSFYGVVDSLTRARGACSFPRNSTMLQLAHNGMPGTVDGDLIWHAPMMQIERPGDNGYYKALTELDHPDASEFNDDGIAADYVYWSGDGTVEDGCLKIIWLGTHLWNEKKEGGDVHHMDICNAAVATYSLDGTPGDSTYLKLTGVKHDVLPENPFGYGCTLWEDEDGYTYLYGATGTGVFLQNVPIVARARKGALEGAWEYYVGDGKGDMWWSSEYPSREDVGPSGIAPGEGSVAMPWIFKKGDWYYMTAQAFPFGKELCILRARNPWGPFTDRKTLLRFPDKLDKLGTQEYRFLYMLNLHPALSREGELVISTNSDTEDFWDNFNNEGSADFYRPYFFRIYDWEKVYDGE